MSSLAPETVELANEASNAAKMIDPTETKDTAFCVVESGSGRIEPPVLILSDVTQLSLV